MDTARAPIKTLLETFNMIKLRQLNELRKENKFCDLILLSEDGYEIKVHKNVISSGSNYFKNLLTLPMKESLEQSISLPDITGDVLEKIIMFIYTNDLEEEIENVEKIIKYAVIFQLEQLVEICTVILSESITDQRCLKYWRLARNNLIYSLEDKCLSYIVSKADHLFESSLMIDLTIEEMKILLGDERLHLQSYEEAIFKHVWKWAKCKVTETRSFSQVFSEVADLFNYAELKQEFILPRIFFDDDLTENAELWQKISKLIKQKYKGDAIASHHIVQKFTQRLFGFTQNKMFIGLGEDSCSTIEKDFRYFSFAFTTFENKFLICGGGRSCEIYEPNSQQWKPFPSMKTEKYEHQCSYLDNKIYACGGIDSKTVEIFDLDKGEWDYGPEMSEENFDFGLIRANGSLYAIGGETEKVSILDTRTQKWNVVHRGFPGISGGVRCVSIGPSIYCFVNKKRHIFDIRTNKFTEEICVNDDFVEFNLCELDSCIYCLGYQCDSKKYSLNLIQYHLNGSVGFKKSYGLYDSSKPTAIVSLYHY